MKSFKALKPSLRMLCGLALAGGVAMMQPALAAGSAYAVHNLVSDGSVPADHLDANLKNAWGVAFNPTGFVWVSNNATGTSTLYDGAGVPQTLVVTVPPAPGGSAIGTPTGIVFSGGTDFVVGNGTTSGPSRFIFSTEDGTISGWAPNVDFAHALVAVNQPGSSYKGLALAANASGDLLYAANFAGGRIDVFDSTFAPTTVAGRFKDKSLPPGFAPFNIQALGGLLYVTYAKHEKNSGDEKDGRGLGLVDVFDTDGHLLHRLDQFDRLNAPWGLALAPAGFGEFSNALLVGNFGDGTVLAIDPSTGRTLGRLKDSTGRPLHIDGLWGLAFGNGVQGQDTNVLYFAAGPNHEAGGVYGSIALVNP
jgi:uncharacterized protein (TIGR03118 family)